MTRKRPRRSAPPNPTRAQAVKYWSAAALDLPDKGLFAKWDMVGQRMAREAPLEFLAAFVTFSKAQKHDTSTTSIAAWKRFGRKLIVKDRLKACSMLCALAILNARLGRARKLAGVRDRKAAP